MIDKWGRRVLSGLVGCALVTGLTAVSPVGIGSTTSSESSASSGPRTALLAAPADGMAPPAPATTTAPPATSEATPEPRPTRSPEREAAVEVIRLTNAERKRAGCEPLKEDDRLTTAAQAHATDMATNRYLSHTSRDGRTFADRIRDAGYPRPGAENIARGQTTPQRVMADWMASDGHRANILNCKLRAIGVAYDPRGHYWVQNFGR